MCYDFFVYLWELKKKKYVRDKNQYNYLKAFAFIVR